MLLGTRVNKASSSNSKVYDGPCFCVVLALFGGVAMIEFFLTTRRLVRAVACAWKRDPQFRSLTALVLVTLVGGTIFYSL